MGSKFNHIEEITPMKETWRIKVRIIHLWKVPVFGNPSEESIEMVLFDEKGTKIVAVVKKSLVNKFSPFLKEGECRTITNFGVGQNLGSYRAANHQYNFFFFKSTSVRMCEDFGIPLHGFSFVSFNEIISKSLDDTYLIDVIGEIVAIGTIVIDEKEGKEQRRISLELRDLEQKTLKCTFWNDYANKVSEYVANGRSGPLVMIIQLAKIKNWQGESSLSNSLFSTQLHFNENIDAIIDFKRKIVSSTDALALLPVEQSSQRSQSLNDDFMQGHMKKTLDEIRESQQAETYTTVATIICIQAEYNWYYLSCKRCGKKVREVEEDMPKEGETMKKLYCMKCCVAVYAIPRYKVQVRVIDESGSASFVMFDREVKQILHKSAYELRESLAKTSDNDSFPEELNELLNKKFLFKVQISEYNIKKNWQTYTVNRLSENEELIRSFQDDIKKDEVEAADYVVDSVLNEPIKLESNTKKDTNSMTGDNYHQSEAEEGNQFSPTLKRRSEMSVEEDDLNVSSTKKRVIVKQEKDSS